MNRFFLPTILSQLQNGFTKPKRYAGFLCLLTFFFCAALKPGKTQAQGIDDMGVVWSKTYGTGRITNIKPNPKDAGYVACGEPWNTNTPAGLQRTWGMIIELDESGNELRRATVQIPQSYIANHTVSRAEAYFNIAFKTDDGGILAFGHLYNIDAPPEDKESNWISATEPSYYLTDGAWIVKFNADLSIALNTLVRGTEINDGWRTSDGKFVIGGFDAAYERDTYKQGGITLLRRYNQDGSMDADADARDSYREIRAICKYPSSDDFVAVTPNQCLRIDPSLNKTAVNLTGKLPQTSTLGIKSLSPSLNGAIFVQTPLNANNVSEGWGTYKLNSDNSVAYSIINQQSSGTTFTAPLRLPGSDNPPKYIGTAQSYNSNGLSTGNKIYEMTDNGAFTFRIGDPYPDGTMLKTVSQRDGFFSIGATTAASGTAGLAAIAKLSICANFILNAGDTEETLLARSPSYQATFAGRTLGNTFYTGSKGTVTYNWTLTDITPGGNGVADLGTASGNQAMNPDIPAKTFTLVPGKAMALLQYTVTAVDSYSNNGTPQTCQQTQTILVKIMNYSDNISNAECYVEPPAAVWGINQDFISDEIDISTYISPVAGDLDGDGIPEILVAKFHEDSGNDHRLYSGIYIYWGHDRQHPTLVQTVDGYFESAGFSIAKVKIEGVYKSIIVTEGYLDGYLYAYDPDPSKTTETDSRIWQSDYPLDGFGPRYGYFIGFVDFDSDGEVEIYAGNQIFDAATGTMLVNGGSSANKGFSHLYYYRDGGIQYYHYFPFAADVTGDGKPEYLAGTEAYAVHINDRTGYAQNSMTRIAGISDISFPGGTTMRDGVTCVADINLDGRPDVVIVSALNQTTYGLAVWDVQTQSLIATGTGTTVLSRFGMPFIGNIDSEPNLEILLTSSPSLLSGFRWDGSQSLVQVYSSNSGTIQDLSGATGITMFDFNQDNIMEFVYRDETHLRIMEANGTSFSVIKRFEATSGTAGEHPIVVDVDNDGHAEIVTVGGTSSGVQGSLRIFNSGSGTTWAPARKVWNQYMYNAVHINDDLTVPPYQINPATFFPGAGGAYGDGNDIQPYNSFLQQQTILSADGTPFWLAPNADVSAATPAFHYHADGDSLTITFDIANLGEAGLQAPFYLSAYKNTVDVANLMDTDSSMTTLNPDVTLPVTLTIHKFSDHLPLTGIVIRVNDRGEAAYIQPECDTLTNNVLPVPFADLLLAHNDRASTVAGLPVLTGVLTNDTIPAACTTPSLSLLTPQTDHGTAALSGDSVLYTATDPAFTGIDTLAYRLDCDGNTSTAHIYIYVAEKPDNFTEVDCYMVPSAQDWEIQPAASLGEASTYAPPLTGDLDGDGRPEIVMPFEHGHITSASPPGGMFSSHIAQKIKIYKNEGGGAFSETVFATLQPYNPLMTGCIALARVRIDGRDSAIIVVAEADRYLRAYNYNGGLVWESTGTDRWMSGGEGRSETSIGIADFNADGQAEIYTGNRIFDAATGDLLCTGTGNEGRGLDRNSSAYHAMTIAVDIFGTGKLNLVAGSQIYEVAEDLSSMTAVSSVVTQCNANTPEMQYGGDGPTQVIDIDNDGRLDVLVEARVTGGGIIVYIWSPEKQEILAQIHLPSSERIGIPFIGDIDGDGYPEILFISDGPNEIHAYKYEKGNAALQPFWKLTHSDGSAMTGLTLFDFNQDGTAEIVYRDETKLRIINGSSEASALGLPLKEYPCSSGTGYEYPVVADIDGDGSAEILIGDAAGGSDANGLNGPLRIFKSSVSTKWAPARKVWNQYAYNAVNINEDLTVPRYPLSPATVFPGRDEQSGTPDDIRPYNSFLQQQTSLSAVGTPFWPTPDAVFDDTQISTSIVGDSVSISLCIVNQGDAALGSPVYATLYRDSVKPENIITTDSLMDYILPGDTGCLTVGVRDITPFLPFVQLTVRLNDNNGTYPVQNECHCDDSIRTRLSPAIHLMMKKDASLNGGAPNNGVYPNPVSVLYTDVIEYTITAVNANLNPAAGTLVIRDTLPAYLRYATGTATEPSSFAANLATGIPPRDTLTWTFDNVSSLDTVTVTFGATLEEGVSASQPMFVNRAWVTASDTIRVPTRNSTYHQGAGISTVTFSAPARGGDIYNATPQALDFRTSPRSGILVVPNEGYVFAGWSHDAYISLRGERIEACSGIMHYDTLIIYGNVELRADFTPEEYPVRYHLHGGENASANPPAYTIESAAITLEAPSKANDIFTGWTGTNGDEPQAEVVIARGSTGERDYYANYLYSGHEAVEGEAPLEDRIWSFGDELYIRTTKAGAIIRVYSPEGVLHRLQTAVATGETQIKLQSGIYIVTLNNGVGQKIIIEK